MAKAKVLPFVQRAREAVDAHKSAAGSAALTASADDMLSKLERLADLRDRGMLSDAEFDAQKAKLLSE